MISCARIKARDLKGSAPNMDCPELFEIVDPRFRKYVALSAKLEELAPGMRFTEGPVYFGDSRCLLWSDVPGNRMFRWDEETGAVSVYRGCSNYSNGNTRDRQGRLVTCEHGTRSVTRTEWDGRRSVLCDRFNGKRLNSPNDVIVKSDGTIWFTDPTYGILNDYEGNKAERELDGCYVFRLDLRDGSLRVVADDFIQPNGLAFSPDESLLFIADSAFSCDEAAPHHIRVFTVTDAGKLTAGRVFAEVSPGIPDGLRLDTDGNVWTSAADGIHCFSPEGTLLGKIKVPQVVANLAFGGPKKNRLFIAATNSIYSLFVTASGVQVP